MSRIQYNRWQYAAKGSESAGIEVGIEPAGADDHMVEQADVEHLTRLLDAHGQIVVLGAGTQVARRMIVHEYHAARQLVDCRLH